MADAEVQFNFRFQSDWRRRLQKVPVYQQTKFRSYNSIRSWDITISGLEKQRSAILKFYFRFRFRPYHWTGQVIMHQTAKFHSNRTVFGKVMMLYRFSRWRPLRRNFTSGFGLTDVPVVNVYQQTKFCSSIHVWVITIPVRKTKRLPYWNPTSGFDFDYITALGMSLCIRLPNFVQIRPWSYY